MSLKLATCKITETISATKTPPTITSVSPTVVDAASSGTLTIQGTNLEDATVVQVGHQHPEARGEFARERLGWGEDPAVSGRPPITIDGWRRRIDPESSPVGQVCMAVEVSHSREWSSISVAGWRADGSRHLGLVDRRPGTEWLLPRLLDLCARPDLSTIDRGVAGKPKYCSALAIDPVSPAGSLIERLRLAGVEPVVMTTREVGSACSTLQDAVTQGDVWHHGSPDVEDALRGAVRRDIGEGQWAFGRARSARVDVEIDPIVGHANALWLADLVGRGYDVSASIF